MAVNWFPHTSTQFSMEIFITNTYQKNKQTKKNKAKNKKFTDMHTVFLKTLKKSPSNICNLLLQMNNSPHFMEIAWNLFWAEVEFNISEIWIYWFLKIFVIFGYSEPFFKIQNNQ